jgi:hypothetical protein
MTEPFYTARSTVWKVEGTHRQARLEDGTIVDFGVHGAVREYYRLNDEKNLPLPVDYIVAATGG